ncbi:unnamed protein product [Ophioblennius macclurei]
MAGTARLLFLHVLTLLWTLTTGDTDVLCVYMESCVLPCRFQGGSNAVIHWTQMKTKQSFVHGYYLNRSVLVHQDLRFRGRTSLFEEQITTGNASLLLREVQIQDEGRYKCLADTFHKNENSFVNVKVDAPVREVYIRQEGDQIACSSEGIYPEPNLTWTTSSPSNTIPKSTTIVQLSQHQLYNISSSLTLASSHGDVDLEYNCTVSTTSGEKTASLSSLANPRKQKHRSGIAIGQVVGVVLVTAAMGVVPCIYYKCKKARCSGETTVV